MSPGEKRGKMKVFFKYWLPVLLWAGFIFFISSLPGKAIPPLFYKQDILFHIFVYAFLSLLLNRALKNNQFGCILRQSKRIFLVILFCLIYAITDEFHQQFVSGRTSSIVDIIIDSLGVILGSAIYR